VINLPGLKQVIIVRRDLKKFGISIGKLLAHVAHGAVEGYIQVLRLFPDIAHEWIASGQKKIVVYVDKLEDLMKKYRKAISLEIPASIIRDAGLTELPPGTITVVVLGPWFSEKIDKVSGDLPLLRTW